MVMTDPIADMLTQIRNALGARRKSVSIPASKLKVALADALRREGYIAGFDVSGEAPRPQMKINFRFSADGEPAIKEIRRFSSPGCRRYRGVSKLPNVLGGLGTAIVTTPVGVLSDRECREKNVAGEVLCVVT